MQKIDVELPDSLWLQDRFSGYSNPRVKIGRLVKNGSISRLKRGLYLNNDTDMTPEVSGKIANRLYGPSYVSFSYALRVHGLIPEHVYSVTSAAFNKGRKKRYQTAAGSYNYQDVPEKAYPFGISLMGEKNFRFLIASPEKALCDELYRISGVRAVGDIEELLFLNLRVDEDVFHALDRESLIMFSEKYSSPTLRTFKKYLEG